MKHYMTAGAALLLTTSIASAGGLDRSGQGISALFEDGNYAELSFGSVDPSLSGNISGVMQSGDIAPDYSQVGIAMKMQVNDQVSMALIYDQPFGAAVDYSTPGYALTGSGANVYSDAVTVLARYEINPNFSIHGGLRYLQAEGDYAFNLAAYQSEYSQDSGTGYVVGGAYERDDIAMRIALTYSSGIELELDGDMANTLTAPMPESVNLDFQTGIAADTLLFGSVRYVAWDGFTLVDSNNPTGAGNILAYDNDVYTYNIGVGRRFSDAFSASFSIGYEASTGEATGQLGPSDGYISYQIGGAYTLDNGVELSGGVRYVDLGDAVTSAPINGVFNDNHAIGLGLKVAYNF